MTGHYLNHVFAPASIAVIGASERPRAVGAVVFGNLVQGGFQGGLYPVNIRHAEVQGRTAYAHISEVPGRIDLAVIATPAATVPGIIHECGEAGVRAAVVLSAGFGETGDSGRDLQEQLLEHARRYGLRIIGPNCLGVMCPHWGLNATFSHNIAAPGHLALVSQSGALCTSMLDWAQQHEIGFSAMISMGDSADVDFGDVLTYLALDPHTHSILLYVEGVHNARGFISGLRIAGRMKPVVIIKAGRFDAGSAAAISHTGAMVGRDDVFHAAISRAGTVRVYTIDQLFSAAQLLASRNYRVAGNRLGIITNGGGLGVMAADHAAEREVDVPTLEASVVKGLDPLLPAHWSRDNPVDILGDADTERYRAAVSACLESRNFDGLLVMLAPQAMTEPAGAAQAVIDASRDSRKPVLACWMGGVQVEAARELFRKHRLAQFDTPEDSVEAFSYLASFQRNQALLLQVPEPLAARSEPDIEGVTLIIEGALAEGRRILSGLEAMAVLRAFAIPVVPMMEAESPGQALVAAESLGFPVAMKINSPDITHKSDVAGVHLNISTAGSVRSAFRGLVETARRLRPDADIKGVIVESMYQRGDGRELMVGVLRDTVFGPAISIGAGGTMVEVMQDSVVSLPPLNRFIVRRMLSQTRVHRLLGKFRQLPAVNMTEVENVVLKVSELVCEVPQITEMDINPLIADDKGVLVVDARIVIDHRPAARRPYSHMAIHPYPSRLVTRCQLPDGTDVVIRPIRPEDAGIEQDFVRGLSPRAKYFRFMQSLRELTPEMLVRFTQIDYDLEMALIAVIRQGGKDVEVGVARYSTNPDGTTCEFAIVMSDQWRKRGIGFRLMEELIAIARERGLTEMEGAVLAENVEMLELAGKLGFESRRDPDDAKLMTIRRRL